MCIGSISRYNLLRISELIATKANFVNIRALACHLQSSQTAEFGQRPLLFVGEYRFVKIELRVTPSAQERPKSN